MLYARTANIRCDKYYSNFLEVGGETKDAVNLATHSTAGWRWWPDRAVHSLAFGLCSSVPCKKEARTPIIEAKRSRRSPPI